MILFLLAHQDDEFGCFYEIHRMIKKHKKIGVVYLTSGTPDGKESIVRQKESLIVLSKLGVSRESVYFLGSLNGIPDGKLPYFLEPALQSVLNLIKSLPAIEKLYFHAWEGGHQDHDAVYLIGAAIAKKYKLVQKSYQFPLYNGYRTVYKFFRLFACIPSNGMVLRKAIPLGDRFFYLRLCHNYRSQFKSWIGLYPFLLFNYFFNGKQSLQTLALNRLSEQPHDGVLLYERRAFFSYQKFKNATAFFLDQHF